MHDFGFGAKRGGAGMEMGWFDRKEQSTLGLEV
jgi:hypothetical protein